MWWKRIILIFSLIVFILVITSAISGYTLVIAFYEVNIGVPKNEVTKAGEEFLLLKNLDFDQGGWCAYLVLRDGDYKLLPPGIKKRTCFRITNRDVLKKMKSEWKMKVTGGDIATATSSLVFFRDGKAVWESAIVIEDSREGFQSSVFGWIEPTEKGIIKKYIKQFKPIYSPIILL